MEEEALLMTNMAVEARYSSKVEEADEFRDLPDLLPDARLWRILRDVLHRLLIVYFLYFWN